MTEISQEKSNRYSHLPEAKIPNEMRTLKRWTAAKLVDRNGKLTKPPCDDNGRSHDAMNPNNLQEYKADRPGFSLDETDNIIVIDQDDLPENPEHVKIRRELYKRFDDITYMEKSISNIRLGKKEKYHAFGRSTLIKEAVTCKMLGLEIYSHKRYVLMTGQGNGKPLAQPEEMDKVVQWLLDQIKKAEGKSKSETPKPNSLVTKSQGHQKGGEEGGVSKKFQENNLRRAREQLQQLHKLGIKFITDNESFSWLCLTLNSEYFLMPKEEIDEWCHKHDGYDKDTFNRVWSTNRKRWGSGQDNAFFGRVKKLFERHGSVPKNDITDPSRSSNRFEQMTTTTMTVAEDEKPREQISKYLTARGDSVAVSGRPGGGKTTHVFAWMRDLNDEEGLTNVFLNADMPMWMAKDRMWEAGLDEKQTIIIDLRKHRSCHIDDLSELIKKELGNRQIGIICLDNTAKICRILWQSVPCDKKFNSNDDEHAGLAHRNIIGRLATDHNCCVIFIGHPGKGRGSKDKYPGSEQWAAEAGLAYRIYRLNATNLEETPKSVINMFRKNKKKPSKYSLATVFKPRYPVGDYFMSVNDNGRATMIAVNDEIDLDEDVGKKKTTGVNPQLDEYVTKMKAYLLANIGKRFGSKELNRATGYSDINYHWWVGAVVMNTDQYPGPMLAGHEHYYWDLRKSHPIVWCHKRD